MLKLFCYFFSQVKAMECKKPVILIFIALSILYAIMLLHGERLWDTIEPVDVGRVFESSHEHFLVNTPSCFIPMMDAYGPTVKKLVHVNKHTNCSRYHFITYRDNYKVVVNKTSVSKYYKSTFKRCLYTPFTKAGTSDKSVKYLSKQARNFTDSIKATTPFAFVHCFSKNETLIEKQVYAFVFRNKTIDKIMEKRYKHKDIKKRPMNILLFALESTSRLNFIRHMNWTYSFLMKDLGGVEMFGYNKIGLNTFPNMVPVLIGMKEGDMHYKGKYLDKYPFVWKNLSAAGYRTFMSEDDCGIATFQYLKKGFAAPPVDHYWRTYMLGRQGSNRYGYCTGNQLVVEAIIDSMMEFVEVYHDAPHFAFSLISKPTHDNNNGLGIEDLPYYRMLKNLQKKQLLNNTVVIFMGDHGSRYGSLRNTFQGRLEENLPGLFLTLPEWFRKEHKNLYENMKSNAKKLTSNFDIYATLMDIIDIGKGNSSYIYKGKYGKSLLRKIPMSRTCSDIGIPPIYCACSSYKKINSSDVMVKNASVFVVSKVNNFLKDVKDLCTKLTLKETMRAQKTVVNEKFIAEKHTKIVDYVVTVKVNPSKAIFEAGVRYNHDTKNMTLLGSISRLNKYAGQSDCLRKKKNTLITERYCFCKDVLKS